MRPTASLLALDGCRILRPRHASDLVEITVSHGEVRRFPTVVSGTLGVCAKSGPAHAVIANGRRVTFPADAISVRTPGTVWSSEAAPTSWTALNVSPAFLPESGLSGSMAFLARDRLVDVAQVAAGLLRAEGPLEAEELVARLVNAVVRAGAVHDPARGASASNAAIARARDFLRARVTGRPTLDDTARAAGVDKFLLIRAFRRAMGTTPHAFLVGVRLQEARRLLARGHAPVEVALDTGFADQAHLTRWFRRVNGMTPAQYARASRATVAPHAIPFKTSP